MKLATRNRSPPFIPRPRQPQRTAPPVLDVGVEDTPSHMANADTDLPNHTTGQCHCGRTRYRLRLDKMSSDLALSAYCHCSSCQRLNGAPFIWTTHWEEAAVEWLLPDDDDTATQATGGPSSSPSGPNVMVSGETTARGGARLIALDRENPVIPDVAYTPAMTVYEALKGRKWKQRCADCGTPMGSWNQMSRRWSIWPSTLSRSHPSAGPEGAIHPAILEAIRPDHHQFYGPWKLMPVPDGLDKWEGYKEQSQKVAS
ncbi:unnamed protein product [Parajaminaea phylloscopi]